jgi:hypothetical protein
MAGQTRLRIGVMLDSYTSARWVARLLEDVRDSNVAELSLVILNDEPRQQQSFADRIRSVLPNGLYLLYERLDRRWFRVDDDPLDPVDLSDVIGGLDVLRVVPRRKRFVHRFESADIDAIRARGLDVVLRFGFNIIRGPVLESARYGVWSYHHGDNAEYRGGPPLFWEIYEGNPVSGAVLQVLTDALDGGHVIYRSRGATDLTSLHRNRVAVYRKASEFVLRRLRDLAARGPEAITGLETYSEQLAYDRGIYRRPRNGLMLRYLGRVGLRVLRNRVSGWRRRPRWLIGIRRREGTRIEKPSPGRFHLLEPPEGRFYADPMPIEVNGTGYVFFEDFDVRLGRGSIAWVALDDEGRPGRVSVALEQEQHLSYPFVFQWKGQIYMIPETEERRTVELYRATRFPEQWTLEKVLFEGVRAVDATVVAHEGRLWLYVNMSVAGGSLDDELFLFYGDSPSGPWTPHPGNPVVSDVTRARPAGTPFSSAGSLIRPAQDCSLRYGYAMTLSRVEVMTPNEYREVPFARIEPDWYPGAIGTHTLARSQNLEVIDAKVWARR